jgi:hypothetical protein
MYNSTLIKNISNNIHYETLQTYFSHPSLFIYLFITFVYIHLGLKASGSTTIHDDYES